MLNILYVAQTYHPTIGGAERYIDRLAQAMAKRKHKVFVLAPDADTEELNRDYQIIRTRFYEGYKKGIFYYFRAGPMSTKIGKMVKELNIDVVHFQYINPFATPIRFLRSKDAKVFATIHGSGLHFMKDDWLGKRLLRRVLKRIDGVAPVSDYCADLAKKWGAPDESIYVIYNGTDPEIFTPEADEEKINHNTVLTACRLVPRKDITTLLKALKVVIQEFPKANLAVAGSGPDEIRLKNLTKKLDLVKNVKFTGFVSDERLLELYKHSGLFVLPAKYDPGGKDIEGFGIALIEAMASGRPVIGANVGGIPSAVKDPWGFLYEPEDWNELGEKIIHLMKNKDIADNMGKKGREAVKKTYNWKKVAKKMEDMYISVH
jgi:phosphatidylinositol alpha-1,6-mannosyltransferase